MHCVHTSDASASLAKPPKGRAQLRCRWARCWIAGQAWRQHCLQPALLPRGRLLRGRVLPWIRREMAGALRNLRLRGQRARARDGLVRDHAERPDVVARVAHHLLICPCCYCNLWRRVWERATWPCLLPCTRCARTAVAAQCQPPHATQHNRSHTDALANWRLRSDAARTSTQCAAFCP